MVVPPESDLGTGIGERVVADYRLGQSDRPGSALPALHVFPITSKLEIDVFIGLCLRTCEESSPCTNVVPQVPMLDLVSEPRS
jgi:hypothetical protein